MLHRLHEGGRDQPHVAGVLAVGDVLVAERELVRGRSAGHLGVAVERLAVARLDRPAALGPQPVGDRARDLALAGAGRADQPQEPRPARLLHVQQRAGDPVDRLAVQLGRVDHLAVGQLDRVGDRVDVEVDLAVRSGAVEVAVGADVVDLLPGGSDRRGHACLLVRVFGGQCAAARCSSRVLGSGARRPEGRARGRISSVGAADGRAGGQAPKTAAATRRRAAVAA